jgi:threonine/homoserine/homoserine lactone efflux protein
VKAVGAGYIILLGLRAIRDRRALSKALDAPVVPRSDRRIFLEGFIVGAVFVLIALVCDSAWVFVAGITRDWFAHSPRRLEAGRRCRGIDDDRRRDPARVHRPEGLGRPITRTDDTLRLI